METTKTKKKIAVFYTGGTISMKKGDDGGINIQEKNPLAGSLDDNVELVITEQVFGESLPSSRINERYMLMLRNAIMKAINSHGVDGVVVTHGTDSIEETAYFLDITIPTAVPIVLTGAMRSSDVLGSDALYNYQCAIKVAICKEAKEKGVLVVLNDDIHTACSVTKNHTTNLAAFQSPEIGPIGSITAEGAVIFRFSTVRQKHYDIQAMTKKVILMKAFAGIDTLNFDALEALAEKYAKQGNDKFPIDGLVIEAFGAGSLPPSVVACLQKLESKGIPIVLASRCPAGSVQPIYAYEGGAKHIKAYAVKNVIFSGGLSGLKSRIKLAVLLEKTTDPKELEKEFLNAGHL